MSAACETLGGRRRSVCGQRAAIRAPRPGTRAARTHNGSMTPFSEVVSLCRRLEANRGRLEKRRLVAEFLRQVRPDEIEHAVAFLTGRPFPASDPRVLSVRGLPDVASLAHGGPLGLHGGASYDR